MNHFPERKLKPDDKTDQTRVVWARYPPKKAIVFVHGYMGSAIPTWTMFESLLPLRPKAKDYDLYFYGYNCFSASTVAEGLLLCAFLQQLHSSPMDLAKSSLPLAAGRATPFHYESVLLVGHSIGAIVCRRALLYARDSGYGWMPQTTMVLFAPAHNGALVSELLKDLGWSWLKLVIGAWRYASPLVDEVAPGSSSIRQLREETIKAVKAGADYLKAAKVVIAEIERVVSNLQFKPVDPVPAVPFRGTTHTSVCKPHAAFTYPLEQLEEVM